MVRLVLGTALVTEFPYIGDSGECFMATACELASVPGLQLGLRIALEYPEYALGLYEQVLVLRDGVPLCDLLARATAPAALCRAVEALIPHALGYLHRADRAEARTALFLQATADRFQPADAADAAPLQTALELLDG